MGQVKVETVTVRKTEPVSKPQPRIEARRVVVNNQVQRLHSAAASSNRSNVTRSTSRTTQVTKSSSSAVSKSTAKSSSKSTAKASSKRAVRRLSKAKRRSKRKA